MVLKPKTETSIKISEQEPLVLLELLHRFEDTNELKIEDQAEQRVLWDLGAQLEKKLLGPLSSDYRGLLAAARAKIRD